MRDRKGKGNENGGETNHPLQRKEKLVRKPRLTHQAQANPATHPPTPNLNGAKQATRTRLLKTEGVHGKAGLSHPTTKAGLKALLGEEMKNEPGQGND